MLNNTAPSKIDDEKNIFLARGGSLQGKGLLVINGGDDFTAAHAAGYKSKKNNALRQLHGQRATIRKNKAGTCFVLCIGDGGVLSVGTAKELCLSTEALNDLAQQGKSWWCKTTNGGGCESLWVVAA